MMKAHPLIAWEVISYELNDDLVIGLRLITEPERIAEVRVISGEVFILRFAGHESTDFAYEGDADQIETLTGRLELASLALIGPTRIIVRATGGGRVVRSQMVIDPEGENPQRDTVASWPLRRLRSRLLLRRVTEQVLDFERVAPS